MKNLICPSASDSDVARSWYQLIVRKLVSFLITLLRLNHAGFVRTELIQALQPVVEVNGSFRVPDIPNLTGFKLRFRCGHGRLLWRARTFYTEEPDTIKWLDALGDEDMLWDVGANVGMYSIYASKIRGTSVYAFEPEAQNYALLVENILLNDVGNLCFPMSLAIAGTSGFGRLGISNFTKGGAWNQFRPEDLFISKEYKVDQHVFGMTLDDLLEVYRFPCPTHVKIDVDGIEPDIIGGARRLMSDPKLKSVLMEVDLDSERHRSMQPILESYGFKLDSATPTGQACHPGYIPTVNMIFVR